jgi:type II secretory pathway pseudopilin PulG
MQLIPNFPPPAPLPDPPVLERLTLEESGWTAATILLLGLCASLILNHFGRGPLALRVGVISLAAAAGLWGLGRAIDTPRERLARSALSLVEATTRADRGALSAVLAPDVALVGGRIGSLQGKDAMIDRVEQVLGSIYQVRSWAVLDVQSHLPDAKHGQTQLLIRVEDDTTRSINFSWWLIDWSRGSTGTWTARRIEPLAIQGVFNAAGR